MRYTKKYPRKVLKTTVRKVWKNTRKKFEEIPGKRLKNTVEKVWKNSGKKFEKVWKKFLGKVMTYVI